jgi:hypothetical protein
MGQYADQRAHDVAWMTAAERAALDTRRELCGARVTLNGEPAMISGASRDFANVTQLGTGLSCEWAWSTVARIVAKGGEFKS